MANRIAESLAYVKRVLSPREYQVTFLDKRGGLPRVSSSVFRKKRHAYVFIDNLLKEGVLTQDGLVSVTSYFRVNLND